MSVPVFDFDFGIGDSCQIPLNFFTVTTSAISSGGVPTIVKTPMNIDGYQFAFALTKYLAGAFASQQTQNVVQAYPPIYWVETLTQVNGITSLTLGSDYTAIILPGTYAHDLKWKSPSGIINTLMRGRATAKPSPVGAF